MIICPPITFVVAYARKFLLYENYVIYSLPGVVICAAAGLSLLASWLEKLSAAGAHFAVDGGSVSPGLFRLYKRVPAVAR